MVTCTLTCGKVNCILDPPKHWPLGRDVHVNYLSEHVQKLTKVTPVQCDVVWRPLSNTHQSPGMPKECAVVTQCCNSSRNAHLFEKNVNHSTKIILDSFAALSSHRCFSLPGSLLVIH